jgi:hypothetical protein
MMLYQLYIGFSKTLGEKGQKAGSMVFFRNTSIEGGRRFKKT